MDIPPDQDPEDAFCYCDRLQAHSIRLIYVFPGHDQAPIACRLSVFMLPHQRGMKQLHYTALSYVWGSPDKPAEILCNGVKLPVTRSLFHALWRIRQLNRNEWWWVDAICINQADDTEKTSQVRMMQEIYTRSQNVLAWLGEEDPFTEATIKLMSKLYDLVTGPLSIEQDQASDLDVAAFELPELDNPIWTELFRLLGRPWFQRVWIVQEIVTAPNGVFMVGHHIISLSVLFTVSAAVNRFQNLTDHRILSQEYHNRASDEVPTAAILHHLRDLYAQGFRHNIATLLRVTIHFKSSDPRDKIFALIGLSRDVAISFIDYNKDLNCINTEIMKIALSTPLDIDILSQVCRSGRTTLLPSWVADLSRPPIGFTPLANAFTQVYLPPSEQAILRFGPNNTLDIHGKLIDVVQTTIDEVPYNTVITSLLRSENNLHAYNVGMYSWIQKCEDLSIASKENIDGTTTQEAFWRAIIFDTINVRERATDTTRVAFKALVTVLKLLANDGENLTQDEKDRQEILSSGRAFRRDHVMAGGAIGFFASFFAARAMVRAPLMEIDAWLSALRSGLISLGTLYLLMLQCPYAITKQMEETETSQQKILKLSRTYQSIRLSLARFPPRRKFFKSGRGVIGWVPETAIAGDLVCIFKGCRIPFVVRRLERGFQLLGDCYLQGLMNGEAWISSTSKVEDITLV